MPRAVDERQRRERDEVRAGAFGEGVDGESSHSEAVHFRDAVLASASTTEVCVARKRARGPESRRSRRHACRALCHAFGGVSAACRARFCCVLAPRCFLPLSARDGRRFTAGFARRGCGLPSFDFASFGSDCRDLIPAARVKSANSLVKCRITGFPIARFRNPEIKGSSSPRAGRHRSPLEKHPWPHALTRVPLVV